MDDYECKVSNSHAIQSQNSSKSTGHISKFTSNFTSKTDQIRLGGGAMGGPTPSTRASPRLYSRPDSGRPPGEPHSRGLR